MREPTFVGDILSLTNRHPTLAVAASAMRKDLIFARVIDLVLSDDAGGNDWSVRPQVCNSIHHILYENV